MTAFYGGTALRIFYDLDRFSEDLDFALLKPDKDFSMEKYFPYIIEETKIYGLNLKINKKNKTKESNIMSAFLKGDTKEHILIFFPDENVEGLSSMKEIKIKIEVDINPPVGANYELKYKILPLPHQIRLYDKSSLFSGKIHAILCRGWDNRIKGRDLYDYIFYLSKNIKVNMELIKEKLIDSKVIKREDKFNIDILRNMLEEKLKKIDFEKAKKDVTPFISDTRQLEVWSKDFFIEITKKLENE